MRNIIIRSQEEAQQEHRLLRSDSRLEIHTHTAATFPTCTLRCLLLYCNLECVVINRVCVCCCGIRFGPRPKERSRTSRFAFGSPFPSPEAFMIVNNALRWLAALLLMVEARCKGSCCCCCRKLVAPALLITGTITPKADTAGVVDVEVHPSATSTAAALACNKVMVLFLFPPGIVHTSLLLPSVPLSGQV